MMIELIQIEHGLCTCCMEEHDVKRVRIPEHTIFKDVRVDYMAECFYCELAEEFYENEEMMNENSIKIRDAYRKQVGLLTSDEIKGIRSKYGISQKDLCILLGWGGKTITRYETYQVQNKAHDTILKKLGQDPEWFITLLCEVEEVLPTKAYKRYYNIAQKLYESQQNQYVKKGIELSKFECARNLLGIISDELIAEKIGLPLTTVLALHK